MARGEGATTKQLEQAIIDAANGAHVFYLTMGPTPYYKELAVHLTDGNYPILWNATQNRLTVGAGAIHFRRGDDGSYDPENTRGHRDVMIMRDHAL